MLQQYLPFTVLKLSYARKPDGQKPWLQQYLPFTVLKQRILVAVAKSTRYVATVLTVYGIETQLYDYKL